MRFEILTLFPRFFDSPLKESLLGAAIAGGLVRVRATDLRTFTTDRHRIVDGIPFGGGAGMVLKAEPLVAAVEWVRREAQPDRARVVLLTPQGAPFTQAKARAFAGERCLALVCGRYEGVDERVSAFVDEELSVGDYVLSGGEAAALVVVEAVARLLPGVVGNAASTVDDSFEEGLLGHPQYTRPRVFRGMEVPEVLRSGDHARVARWRRRQALRRTRERRPDLMAARGLREEERALLEGEEGEGERRPAKRA